MLVVKHVNLRVSVLGESALVELQANVPASVSSRLVFLLIPKPSHLFCFPETDSPKSSASSDPPYRRLHAVGQVGVH